MPRPLYAIARQQAMPLHKFHHGLWWERFFDGYPDGNFGRPEQGKARFIETLARPCGDKDQLLANAERQINLLCNLGGVVKVYITDWHFATGLGAEHPTENGFAWHRTLGTPYLPGSSVKGMVRGWIEWNGEEHQHFSRIKDWFGGEDKTSEQAGWFIFFDALPTGPVTLAADVMTPHMGQWYESGGEIGLVSDEPDPSIVPADWHSPNPVTFLVVKNAKFQFGVAVRENLTEKDRQQAQDELGQAVDVLEEALQWAGAGAKTATGYGRMSPDSIANTHLAKQRKEREAQSQPLETRLSNEIKDWSEPQFAEIFGPKFNKTQENYGNDFPLLFSLAKLLREKDIERWKGIKKNGTNKGDKDRHAAYRKFNPTNST